MSSVPTAPSAVTASPSGIAGESGGLSRGVLFSLAAVYLIWSSTFLALRFMVRDLPPLATSGVRFLLAGVVLYAVLRVRGAAAPTVREWAWAAGTGTAMFFLGNGLVAIAAREVPSGVTAMSIGTVPLFLSAMEAVLGQRPSVRQCLGLGLGFSGVVCMGVSDVALTGTSLSLLVLAPLGWAAASLIVRRGHLPVGAMAGAAQLIGGGGALLLGGLALGERFTAMPGSTSILAFAYLVVFGSIVGYSAALYLLRNASASVATSYAYVNPVLALVLGATLGGERLGPNAVLAAILVVSGVAVLVTSARTEPAPVEAAPAGRRSHATLEPER